MERGIFQKAVDRVIEYGRRNKGEATTEMLVAGSAVAYVGARPDLATAAIIGSVVVGIASGFSRYESMISKQIKTGDSEPIQTIPQNEELILADFTEESPPTA